MSFSHLYNNSSVDSTSLILYLIILGMSSSAIGSLKSPSYSWTFLNFIVTCISLRPTLSFCENNIVSKSKVS